MKNCAYIDSQNLHLGIQKLGWKLNYKRYRVYLKEKYQIETAYLFIGYLPENQGLYDSLQKSGFVLKFKPVLPTRDGQHKGNVDADLVLQVVVDYFTNEFEKALIVTSDGDFYSLVHFLYKNDRLLFVMSSHIENCSMLLKKTGKEKIVFMQNLRDKLEYKQKSTA